VEVPCLVNGTGVRPCTVGELPPRLAALDRTTVDIQALAVQGIPEDDLDAVGQAIKLDPLTAACNLPEIEGMIDALLVANAGYLPNAPLERGDIEPAVADD